MKNPDSLPASSGFEQETPTFKPDFNTNYSQNEKFEVLAALASVRSTLAAMGITPDTSRTRLHAAMMIQVQCPGEIGYQFFKAWVREHQAEDDVSEVELVRVWHNGEAVPQRPAQINGARAHFPLTAGRAPAAPPGTSEPFVQPSLPKCDARDGTADTRPLTEYGNAQRLFDAHSDSLRYVFDAQKWIVWNGAAWEWDAGSIVRSLTAALRYLIYSEGARHINDADHIGKWARKSQEQRTINAAVSLLSDFAPLRLLLACIDADHYAIGFDDARQVIDLRNGTTRPAAPLDYITKSLGVNIIGDAAKAVRWRQFLEQIFNADSELIDWLQRFCGYLLTGSTQEQIFLFCFGHGANGKSVFIELLKHMMGDYARAIASETLSDGKRQAGGATPDLADLIGSRLVLCSETEDNSALAESLVKSLVSGDSMAVRQLYAAPVQFMPNFKLIISGNHKPIIRGNDCGIWRRVRLIPFNRTFSPSERDPHLLDKLKVEAPHILAWMIQGCAAWQAQGLADTPEAISQATDDYQADQDLTGRWLDECTMPSKYGEVASGDLYADYENWCKSNGLRTASNVALGRRLSERGYQVRQTNGKRLWCGLSLRNSRQDSSANYLRATGGD